MQAEPFGLPLSREDLQAEFDSCFARVRLALHEDLVQCLAQYLGETPRISTSAASEAIDIEEVADADSDDSPWHSSDPEADSPGKADSPPLSGSPPPSEQGRLRVSFGDADVLAFPASPHPGRGGLVSFPASFRNSSIQKSVSTGRPSVLSHSRPVLGVKDVVSLFKAQGSNFTFTEEEQISPIRRAVKIVTVSGILDSFIFVVVIASTVLVGLRVDRMAANPGNALPMYFDVCDHIFFWIYVVELAMRIFVYRQEFHRSSWNLFDLFVVLSQAIDWVAAMYSTDGDKTSIVASCAKVLRNFRFIRMVRVLRIIPFLNEMNSLVLLVYSSFWAFVWSSCLLLLLTYIFACFVTQAVAEHRAQDASRSIKLEYAWGSLLKSCGSLYESVMGGVDWAEYQAPLNDVHWGVSVLFFAYIGFAALVLLNLVTGVFVTTAQQLREDDRKQQLHTVMRQSLHKLGLAHTDTITHEQFVELLEQRSMARFLAENEMNPKAVTRVFRLLRETEGSVSGKSFQAFMMRLEGQSKAIEVAATHLEATKERHRMKHLLNGAAAERREIYSMHTRASEERQRMKAMISTASAVQREMVRLHRSTLMTSGQTTERRAPRPAMVVTSSCLTADTSVSIKKQRL